MEKHIKYYSGQHCETTATGTLLLQLGIDLSEPMLFGLGQGLSFIFWNMKSMSSPFIGGRNKPDVLTQNIAKHLQLTLTVKETSSKQKAWNEVRRLMDQKTMVGLKLDCYHLEYFTSPIHFAGHYVAIYDYDDHFAYLVDTQQQGGLVKTSLQSLELARSEKGPMSSKNLYYTLCPTEKSVDLKVAVLLAIKQNAQEYLHPAINNISFKGILKTSSFLNSWFQHSKNKRQEFTTTALLMEKAGTGGALFRNLYRDFLQESYQLLSLKPIYDAHKIFSEVATRWTFVSQLLNQAGFTEDIQHIHEASRQLQYIAENEKRAMELLVNL